MLLAGSTRFLFMAATQAHGDGREDAHAQAHTHPPTPPHTHPTHTAAGTTHMWFSNALGQPTTSTLAHTRCRRGNRAGDACANTHPHPGQPHSPVALFGHLTKAAPGVKAERIDARYTRPCRKASTQAHPLGARLHVHKHTAAVTPPRARFCPHRPLLIASSYAQPLPRTGVAARTLPPRLRRVGTFPEPNCFTQAALLVNTQDQYDAQVALGLPQTASTWPHSGLLFSFLLPRPH